jgi:hypothetical protein
MEMVGRLRSRLTYANVMSTIAVVGVLGGGGAYAASKIGPNDIAKNAVRSKHIAPNQVKGVDAKEGSFGTVPRAKKAGSADQVDGADICRADLSLSSTAGLRTLCAEGPVSVTARCINEPTDTTAYVFLETTADGAFLATPTDNDPNFNENESAYAFLNATDTTDNSVGVGHTTSEFILGHPSGARLAGVITAIANHAGSSGTCRFPMGATG